jgi:CheY-like chemotaxis protein
MIYLSNLNMFLRICALLLCCLVGKAGICQDTQRIDMNDFLRQAVTDGLYADRFPVQLAQKIKDNESTFFVTKCPICMPVGNALNAYLRIKTKHKRTKTPNDILKGFASEDKTARQIAFSALIERYVTKAYDKLEASPTAKKALLQALEEGKKSGMAKKRAEFGTFCPSCEGACKPKK